MMYKCPNCGKLSTSMYCDTCERAIPRNCAVDTQQFSGQEPDEITSSSTNDIKSMMKTLVESISSIEHDTHIIYIIALVSMIISVISAVFAIISVTSLF